MEVERIRRRRKIRELGNNNIFWLRASDIRTKNKIKELKCRLFWGRLRRLARARGINGIRAFNRTIVTCVVDAVRLPGDLTHISRLLVGSTEGCLL